MEQKRSIQFPATDKAEELVRWGLEAFHPQVALACSFSLEDVALIDMAVQVRPDARVFAIDTGRLNEETYRCADEARKHFKIAVEWHFPKREDVERLEREKGLYSFRESLEARQECCRIRKVEPLARALQGLKAWITGLRQEQSITRGALKAVDYDQVHGGIIKINPLVLWKSEQLWDYIRRRKLPYNRLYDRSYASIGCEPCTRAVAPGAEARSGRWWWESPEHKECGLHVREPEKIATKPARARPGMHNSHK
ncbi:MAG: phosphoadenylyl-sulfate reductase [Lentisphaerae bacterium]|nr:phosphoadenylyl-sulfate reductase [Lentisphaerota bacterium]